MKSLKQADARKQPGLVVFAMLLFAGSFSAFLPAAEADLFGDDKKEASVGFAVPGQVAEKDAAHARKVSAARMKRITERMKQRRRKQKRTKPDPARPVAETLEEGRLRALKTRWYELREMRQSRFEGIRNWQRESRGSPASEAAGNRE